MCALYPDLMNIYADRGNLLLLAAALPLAWDRLRAGAPAASASRSIPMVPTSTTWAGARTAISSCAPLTWPGTSARRCMPRPSAVRSSSAVCGGYQLLGHSYQLGDEMLPGRWPASICSTVRADGPRLIGNVAIEVELGPGSPRVLAGFENHGGRTQLGAAAQPLGRVLQRSRQRWRAAAMRASGDGNVIGTYLHGPLLPKNAWFADWLIARRSGSTVRWPSSTTGSSGAAHADARRAAGVGWRARCDEHQPPGSRPRRRCVALASALPSPAARPAPRPPPRHAGRRRQLRTQPRPRDRRVEPRRPRPAATGADRLPGPASRR